MTIHLQKSVLLIGLHTQAPFCFFLSSCAMNFAHMSTQRTSLSRKGLGTGPFPHSLTHGLWTKAFCSEAGNMGWSPFWKYQSTAQ